jgi:hypothetical protein
VHAGAGSGLRAFNTDPPDFDGPLGQVCTQVPVQVPVPSNTGTGTWQWEVSQVTATVQEDFLSFF